MFLETMTRIRDSVLITSVIIGAVFLLSVENVYAVASLNLSTSFESADPARGNASMDSAGTWDGVREVTDGDPTGSPATLFPQPDGGDDFILTVVNAAGAGAANTAFDIDISVNVPAGFRLPTSTMVVQADATAGACADLSFNARQPGGTGALIVFDVPNNTDIDAGCTYEFHLGLTTNDQVTFAPTGLQDVTFNFTYNETNNNNQVILPPISESIQVNPVNALELQVIKTATTTVAANGEPVIFNVLIRNLASSGMFDVELTDLLGANLIPAPPTPLIAPVAAPGLPPGSLTGNQYTFEYLAAGQEVNLTITSEASVVTTSTSCPVMNNNASVEERTGVSGSGFAEVDFSLTDSLQLTHDLVNSFCELCGLGTVRLTAENIGGISLDNVILYEDLGSSGLTFVPGTVFISIDGGPLVPAANPEPDPLDAANQQRFRWTPALVPELTLIDSPFAVTPTAPVSIEFVFQVQRITGLSEEQLVFENRNIQPEADYDLSCNNVAQAVTGALVELPIRQPHPQVTKLGRNVDAGMAVGDYAPLVAGHIEDSIIWRVETQNTGLAGLEDLEMDDFITGGNFDINWVCNSEATATAAAAVISSGSTPAGCIPATAGPFASSVPNLDIDDTTDGPASTSASGFGNPNNDEPVTYVDVAPNSASAFIYYVGRIQSACSLNPTNTANIEWGCEGDGDSGGLFTPASNNGVTPAFNIESIAIFNAQVDTAGLDIQQAVTGVNTAQPVGSTGFVTIQITNLTGSTIRDLVIQDILPVGQYVVDSTFTPTAVVTPAFGAYDGMIDTITSDIDTTPANLLNNIEPTFTLTSSTQRAVSTVAGDDRNLLREGDVLTLQFRIVLIEASRYDLAADINVAPEVQADNTDPDSDFSISNTVTVDYSNICSPVNSPQAIDTQSFPVDVEDLDVDISDALFILTNDVNTPLTLNVLLTNNGGHDADNHVTYVTFGQAMTVQTIAPGCGVAPVANPPPHPLLNTPAFIPASASVYACDRGVLAPGVTETFSFDVIKNTVGSPLDDLTFRADVVGEVTLSDGAALTLPAPASLAITTPNQQLANNYTLDSIRSRVLGFNLTHTVWYCTESGTAEPFTPTQFDDFLAYPLPVELDTQIGEDCHSFIESGGWFGFLTPGFDLIAIRDIEVTAGMEGVPAVNGGQGLGLIPFAGATVYDFHDTDQDTVANPTPDVILNGVNGGASTTSLDQSPIVWQHNNNAGQDITEKDKFFRVNYKTRLLNDDVDLAYPVPGGFNQNLHGRISSNIVTTSFHAIFEDDTSAINIDLLVDETTPFPGYPVQAVRQIDLTDVEPNLLVTKTVCNETVTLSQENHNLGTSCSTYQQTLNNGDTNDSYVYRISLINESPTTPGRSPAYDVVVTDVLDASDLMLIEDFLTDNLDNDGDGDIDEADEGTILTDNILDNGNPAQIEFDFNDVNTVTAAANRSLLQIDAGQEVLLYYRVNPSDAIAPLQPLTNVVSTSYDSLVGDSGNQNTPQLLNTENTSPNETGRARIYTAIDNNAIVRMLPLQSQPKIITATSNTPLTADPSPQNQSVVVGEEVRYELQAIIPVTDLDDFVITDELPHGMRCVATNYPAINLTTDPAYTGASFSPGGPITPVCTRGTPGTAQRDVIVWNFGNQEVRSGPVGGFDFRVDFVARVENTTVTVDPDATVDDATFVNECALLNGGSLGSGAVTAPTACSSDPTLARLTYTETFSTGSSNTETINYAAQRLVLREPQVVITKEFLPVVNADAQDVLTVNVSVVNNGTAPAYNVQILDDLSLVKFNYVLNSEATSGLPDASVPDFVDLALSNDQPVFNWDNPASAGYQLDPGESVSFVFEVEVDRVAQGPQLTTDPHEVEPHDVILNNLEVRWTSLPDLNTALNVSGAIAADGEPLGMRNGQLTGVAPVSTDPPNNYNNNNTSSVEVPSLVFSKTDLNPAVPPQPDTVTIGEHKQFELVIGFPEGITNALTVVDDLNVTGLNYVIENEPGFEITYDFTDIFSINSTDITAMAAADVEALFTAFPDDGDVSGLGTATWNIGSVDTEAEDDQLTNANNPSITINYFARVDNDVNTNAGSTLQNSANLTYNNVDPAGGFTQTTNLQTVVEPQLIVTRTVVNTTKPVPLVPVNPPDAGDVLEYTIEIRHDPAVAVALQSTAFDLNIQENLPIGVSLTGVPVITIDGNPVGDVTPLAGVNTLAWGRTNTSITPGGDETLDLVFDQVNDTGEVLVLTYSVTVDAIVQPNQDLNGTVVVDWTSLQDASPLERTGPGGAACTIVDQNDYCVSDDAPLLVPNPAIITKTADNDTFDDVNYSTANDGVLRIGDTVEYTLTFNLNEGTTANVVLEDTLPAGMIYFSLVSVNGDTGTGVAPNRTFSDAAVPFTYVGGDIDEAVDVSVVGNVATFTIGNVIADSDNVLTNNEFVVIYTAQVVQGILAQSPTTVALANSINLNHDDVNGAQAVTPQSNSIESITARQPQILLTDITKERYLTAAFTGTLIPSGSPAASGSTIYYRLQACNSGDAPAYDVVIVDDLDPVPGVVIPPLPASNEFDLGSVSVPVVRVNNVLATEGALADYTYVLAGSVMTFTFNGIELPPGNSCIEIDYSVDVDAGLAGGNSWDNSFLVDSYASINASDVNVDIVAQREIYTDDIGPVLFNQHNINPIEDLSKTFTDINRPDVNPAPITARDPTFAAVGELITYQIIVPDTGMNGTMHNVEVIDDMDPSLSLESVTLVSAVTTDYGFDLPLTETISFTGRGTNQVRIQLDGPLIGLERATINVVARVDNNVNANQATPAFGNGARFEFANSDGGTKILGGSGLTSVINDVSIVEPQMDITLPSPPNNGPRIEVNNLTKPSATDPPDAGDILEYTVTYTFLGGAANDLFSDAYDVSFTSDVGSGLEFLNNVSTSHGTISAPNRTGNVLTWNVANGTDIDVPEGVTATIVYQLQVSDSALANQTLTNSTVIRWTSLDDDITDEGGERNGNGGLNDYFSPTLVTSVITTDTNVFNKAYLSDTSPQLNVLNIPSDVRIGDVVDYQITLNLQEGTSAAVELRDTLPQGLQFEGIVTINGLDDSGDNDFDPNPAFNFIHPVYTQATASVSGDPNTGSSVVTWTLGDLTNTGFAAAPDDGNNDFVIVYRTRVLDHPTLQPISNPLSNIPLLNAIVFDYGINGGVTQSQNDSETITLQQPNLSVVKDSTQEFGDVNIVAQELITYTVDITNNGQSPAYDVLLEDTLPVGLRKGVITVLDTQVPIGTDVPDLNPVYDPLIDPTTGPATGLVKWNFDNGGPYSIPVGETLRLVFQVAADDDIGAGLTSIVNNATATRYYSFDNNSTPVNGVVTGVREVYGPSDTALSLTTLITPAPTALEKANTVLTASIGVPFSYTITVPGTPVGSALFDVRILDDLQPLSPNVELIFVDVQKVSPAGTWVPVNTGTPTNIVIEDITNGIDISANEQAVIELTVVLRNHTNNQNGDTFSNVASYTFNSGDNNVGSQADGGSDSDVAMTVVEPTELTLQKTGLGGTGAVGNPVIMQFGVPEPFVLDVQNIGAGPAYDITVTDLLSKPATGGGMCDTSPVVLNAQVFAADGITPVSNLLLEGTDFVTVYNPAPVCTFVISMTSADAELLPLNRLIINYEMHLDVGNLNGSLLNNVAAASQWFSADTPTGVVTGEIRSYDRVSSTVSPGTINVVDFEDVAQILVQAPELVIEKRVFDTVTNAQAFTAEPGDDIRYEITISNVGPIAAANFSLTDEADRLNGLGFFVPGTMAQINVSQPTADISNTDINAGNNAAGILDVRNLNLSELAGGNDSLVIDFEMTLQAVIDGGLIVENQAEVELVGFNTLLSDDPDITGVDNPTRTIIGSTPTFRLLKTSQDITGDANVLDAGDILRYTITAQNIGAENSINTLLRDQIPANTAYVANTTTLNGSPVVDIVAGVTPLQDGILINALEDLTPGNMRADGLATTNIATITFDVLVDVNVVNGTVVSNQAFVGGDGFGSGPFSEQHSDDPDTEIFGDPTRDVVGNVAIIDAQATVELIVDGTVIEQVDPGDTLRYTVTISNSGTIPATSVQLFDTVSSSVPLLVNGVPVDTDYVQDSTFLNGVLLADISGNSPLIFNTGIDISSADQTPPVQGDVNADGILSAGQSAILIYDVIVDAASVSGDVIINQLQVVSAEFPDEFTDADGNDLNGDQPTETIVGNSQLLSISKDVFVVGGGTAQPGAMLEYFVRVENIGNSSIDLSSGSPQVLKLFDNIDQADLTYVPGSARLNGVVDPNLVFSSPRLVVNYDDSKRATSTTYMFEPGDQFTVRYLAQINTAAQQGTNIINTVAVDWGAPSLLPVDNSTLISCSDFTQNVDACASVGLAVGGAPGVATLSGSLWHDANLDESRDTVERALDGWEVEIYFGAGTINPGDYLDSVFTDVNGNYSILGLVPNDGDVLNYALRFRPPGASTDTASLGTVLSPFFTGNGLQTLSAFEVSQSSHIPGINLPIQPNGVIYDAVLRSPVPAAVIQMVDDSGVELPVSCFDDPAQQNQRTVLNGYYKFELNFSQPECPIGADYTVNVFAPAGYFDDDNDPNTPNVSAIIPPLFALTDPAFDAVSCPNDPLPTLECEVQQSEFAPPVSIAPRATETNYYQKFTFNNGVGDDQIFNNHIAVDPILVDAVSISKVSSMVNVTRSQLVPYTITLSNTLPAPIYDLNVVDLFPPGFKYIAGSGRIQQGNGAWIKSEPIYSQGVTGLPATTLQNDIDLNEITGVDNQAEFNDIARLLTWNDIGTIDANSSISVKLLLVVGSGVGEGEYVNRAVVTNTQTTGAASGVASATVRVVPDPTFDCSDVIGKVFDDKNLNAYQDEGEEGVPGARVVTAKGLEITADAHGRFHLTCAVIPNPDRGSNFIMKLDERSLPSGYRLTTENPRVVRATRGKMVKINFGAAIHRVVRLDMADAVFEENSTEMRPQWLPRLDILITELAKDPSLLRLSYLAENETESEVNDRLNAVKEEIEKRWEDLNCCYQLMIETEVFWRKGGPVNRGAFDE
ncbi:MAG: hypothetical protein DIZ80_13705 [endosymbiont of Galathealinum brachiosum]|uniref:DUF11 domain-containing protein n=1 Tax=endosymbiont of Galathealinum brachiosum TaxID=2200906 RepID=A0A370DA48_9GAMM|nr:MAG: hypothetical protein DIZ80_13705 [endosymbiont of Galathealinum brachiosum]